MSFFSAKYNIEAISVINDILIPELQKNNIPRLSVLAYLASLSATTKLCIIRERQYHKKLCVNDLIEKKILETINSHLHFDLSYKINDIENITGSLYFDCLLYAIKCDDDKLIHEALDQFINDSSEYLVKRISKKNVDEYEKFLHLRKSYTCFITRYINHEFLKIVIEQGLIQRKWEVLKCLYGIMGSITSTFKNQRETIKDNMITIKPWVSSDFCHSVFCYTDNYLLLVMRSRWHFELTHNISVDVLESVVRMAEQVSLRILLEKPRDDSKFPFSFVFDIFDEKCFVSAYMWLIIRLLYGKVDDDKCPKNVFLTEKCKKECLEYTQGKVWWYYVPMKIVKHLISKCQFEFIDYLIDLGKIRNTEFIWGYAFKYDRPGSLKYYIEHFALPKYCRAKKDCSSNIPINFLLRKAYRHRAPKLISYIISYAYEIMSNTRETYESSSTSLLSFEMVLPQFRRRQWIRIFQELKKNRLNAFLARKLEASIYDFFSTAYPQEFKLFEERHNFTPKARSIPLRLLYDDAIYQSIIP